MIRMSGKNSPIFFNKKPQQNRTTHNNLLSKDPLLRLYLRIKLTCKAKISKNDFISSIRKLHLVLPELNCKRQEIPHKTKRHMKHLKQPLLHGVRTMAACSV